MIKIVKTHFATAASASALAVGLYATVLSANEANAQTSYYWGNTQLDNAVSVNLNVLDNLGNEQTLPGLLNPRASSTTPVLTNELPSSVMASQAPRVQQGNDMPVSGLTTNVAAPAPRVMEPVAAEQTAEAPNPAPKPAEPSSSAMPSSSLVAEAPKAAETPKAAEPVVAEPAPKTPEPVAEPEPVPAPTPVEAPKVAEAEPAPAPEPTPAPAPAAPKVEEPKVVEAPAEEPKPVALTPDPAPAPAPVPAEPKVEEAAPATQTAALTKLEDSDVIQKKDGIVSVIFDPVETDLPKAAQGELDEIVSQMKANEALKLYLEGYAHIPDASPNQSRRMSLFRAISVRNYLVKQEIPSRRIKVRAFGDKADGGNTDRVDVFFE